MGYIEKTTTIRIRSFVPSEPQAPQARQGGLGSPASIQSSASPASGIAGSKLLEGATVTIGFCVMYAMKILLTVCVSPLIKDNRERKTRLSFRTSLQCRPRQDGLTVHNFAASHGTARGPLIPAAVCGGNTQPINWRNAA